MDDIAIYGNGLIEAYKAEQELARDPRIVLTSHAMKHVDKYLAYYGNMPYSPQNYKLYKDSDGQYFSNYTTFILNSI